MLLIQKKLTNPFLALLSLPSTAMGFALSVQIAALSWLLSTQYGLDIHKVGIVWAAGPTAGILGQVTIGLLSDKVWFWGGRRKPFIIIGGILAAIALLLLPNIGYVSERSGISLLTVAIVVALLLDISINIGFNPTRSVIADVTTEEKRTKAYTIMQTVSGSCGMMAYAIGAVFNNFILIYVGVVIVLLFSIIPVFFIKEPRVLGVVEQVKEMTVRKTDHVNFYKLFAAHAFSWLGIQVMFVYIFAHIQYNFASYKGVLSLTEDMKENIGSVINISFLVLNLVGAIFPAFVLNPVANKIGKVKAHMGSIAIMAMAYAGIAYVGDNSYMLYAFMVVAGIGWAAVVSLPFAIMSQQVNQQRMGFYMGIFNLSVVIPQLIVSLVLGKLIEEAQEKDIIFVISAVSLVISTVLWGLVKEPAAVQQTDKGLDKQTH